MTEISIGTAQFGLNYGITNKRGRASEEEVYRILDACRSLSIDLFDTAPAYGNAEALLGRWRKKGASLRVVTKLPKSDKSCFLRSDKKEWDKEFRKSLARLRQESIEGILLHEPNDLRKEGGEILHMWLKGLKEEGLVNMIGASIYAETDLDYIPLESMDIVQLPMSVYDQRLIQSGAVSRLLDRGCKIQARSIFLQGLLLQPAERWPTWLCDIEKAKHKKVEGYVRSLGETPQSFALGFIRSQPYISSFVVGISCLEELLELNRIWELGQQNASIDYGDWALDNVDLLDPRRWRT